MMAKKKAKFRKVPQPKPPRGPEIRRTGRQDRNTRGDILPSFPVAAPPRAPAGGGGGASPAAPRRPMPVLPGAQGRRIAADEMFTGAGASHNSGLYQAALRYGDLALINQLGAKGFGATLATAPEFGELSRIDFGRTQARKATGDNRNIANTFFSGMHGEDLTNIDRESQIAKAEALNRYNDAQKTLSEMLAEAGRNRNLEYAGASQDEFDYAQSLEPEPTGGVIGGGPTGQPTQAQIDAYTKAANAPRIREIRKALMAHGPNWSQRKRLMAELARLRG